MYSTSQFRKGLKIELDGTPYNIVDFQHVKPGKGNAFIRTKMRNLLNGNILEKTFKSGEKVEKPDLENIKAQYLYNDGEDFIFMSLEDYEQFPVPEAGLGNTALFMQENMEVEILMYNGSPIDIEIPTFIEVEIAQTDPGMKGDTVSGATKPATIETGAVIQVPLFVNEGEKVRVDTRTGSYVERVK
jgi:elongation factor P